MELSKEQIINIINILNIKTNNNIRNNWLEILCPNPLHQDKHFGNAAIHLQTGKINCFACGFNISLTKFLKQYDKEKFINIKDNFNLYKYKEKKEKIKKINYNFTYIPLIPENFLYTRQRGFTKQFCEKFNIIHCISGKYNDYFIIPIIDKIKDIFIYEARRLKEHEYLCEFFNIEKSNEKRLKKKFEEYVKDKGLFIDSRYKIIDKNGIKYYNSILKYLLQRKVFYPYSTDPNMTIWNIDNLNFNQQLYLVEGFGSIPKIYQHITKNVSCIFGSMISEEQINYLKLFDEIIYIPDNDIGGLKSVEKLHLNINNLKIIDIQNIKDTDKNYINKIKETEIIESNKYLIRKILSKH